MSNYLTDIIMSEEAPDGWSVILLTITVLIILASYFLAASLFVLLWQQKPPPLSTTTNAIKTALLKQTLKRPPHVISFIPYIGSAISMGKMGISEFIRRSSRRYQDTPVFTATILGDKCVFLADPQYLHSVVFKPSNQKYFDTESLQKTFVRNVLSCTKQQVQMAFHPNTLSTGLSQYHHYLFQNNQLNINMNKVQSFFLELIPTLTNKNDQSWKEHDLFDTVFDAIFQASVGPLLSGSLVVVNNDEVYKAFREFDKGVIPMFNDAPNWFTTKARKARLQLLQQLGSDEFWDMASDLMVERREKLPLLSLETLGKANLGLLWASVGNSAPAVFWTLLRLMQDQEAWTACQEQVDEVVAAGIMNNDKSDNNNVASSFLFYTLEDLDKLTLLESAFWEALRMYQGNFSARTVVEDFVIDTDKGKYMIEKGSKLMPFWGILHQDRYVFENPDRFQYDRFVNKEKVYRYRNGTKVKYFPVVAFGGGSHMCPGRKFIAYEARLFLAMLIRNFDMRLADGETIPGIDPAMQGIGVSHPAKDLKVEIRLRTRCE